MLSRAYTIHSSRFMGAEDLVQSPSISSSIGDSSTAAELVEWSDVH